MALIRANNKTIQNVTTLPTASTSSFLTNLPSGSVLQVVSSTQRSGKTAHSSASNLVVGDGVTITPTSASSKILIIANYYVRFTNNDTGGVGIARNGTPIYHAARHLHWVNAGGTNTSDVVTINYEDTPNTTDPVLYQAVINTWGSGATVTYNINDGYSVPQPGSNATFTAIEIAG